MIETIELTAAYNHLTSYQDCQVNKLVSNVRGPNITLTAV